MAAMNMLCWLPRRLLATLVLGGALGLTAVAAEPPLADLLTQLHNPSAEARRQAAEALRHRAKEAGAALPVLREAAKDDEALVRVAAARAMWAIES